MMVFLLFKTFLILDNGDLSFKDENPLFIYLS